MVKTPQGPYTADPDADSIVSGEIPASGLMAAQHFKGYACIPGNNGHRHGTEPPADSSYTDKTAIERQSMYIPSMNRRLPYLQLILSCTILPVIVFGCTSPVESPNSAQYRTDHFSFHYFEHEYTLSEIEAVADRKEQLLANITDQLEVTYTGTIKTYLFRNPQGKAWAIPQGMTFESRNYVKKDPGHEIIHCVAFAEFGITPNYFMAEGLAEALQMDNRHPGERFFSYCTTPDCDSTLPSIREDLLANAFDHSPLSYYRAGAFIDFCRTHSGIKAVKHLYRASTTDTGSELSQSFGKIFKLPLDSMITGFYTLYYGPGSFEAQPETARSK